MDMTDKEKKNDAHLVNNTIEVGDDVIYRKPQVGKARGKPNHGMIGLETHNGVKSFWERLDDIDYRATEIYKNRDKSKCKCNGAGHSLCDSCDMLLYGRYFDDEKQMHTTLPGFEGKIG